ncbi:MAG: hypothetical protein P1V35_00555 [Planctomycetota bacterium]|nr:hypothetical protein [Planctomycetota bacterium]
MSIVLAITLGLAFGFVLDRVGATNPGWIVKMLNLTHLHLMKTILLGIGVASILMFGGQMLGWVDVGHMSVKGAYAGVFVGGLLLGFGWALSGYCPGTGVCAATAGRRDAWPFIGGGLLGALAYMVTYPFWKGTSMLDGVAGGKVTLGAVPGAKYEGLSSLPGDWLGLVLGAGFVAVAFLLPQSLRAQQGQ